MDWAGSGLGLTIIIRVGFGQNFRPIFRDGPSLGLAIGYKNLLKPDPNQTQPGPQSALFTSIPN